MAHLRLLGVIAGSPVAVRAAVPVVVPVLMCLIPEFAMLENPHDSRDASMPLN
jgi:hypothetical protein